MSLRDSATRKWISKTIFDLGNFGCSYGGLFSFISYTVLYLNEYKFVCSSSLC